MTKCINMVFSRSVRLLTTSTLMLSFLCRLCVLSSDVIRHQNSHSIRHHNRHHRTAYDYNEATSLTDTENPLISCPSCILRLEQLKFLDSDNIRLEAIKQQILLKLGLKTKPNVTHTVPRKVILDTLSRYESDIFIARQQNSSQFDRNKFDIELNQSPSEIDDSHYEPSKIIAFSDKGGLMNGNQILEFSINNDELSNNGESEASINSAYLWLKIDKIKSDDLACSPKLWVFKIKAATINYTERISSKAFEQMTELATSKAFDLGSDEIGWQKFNVTHVLRDWYQRNDQSKLKILIDCSGCCSQIYVHRFQSKDVQNNNKNRPYIVIETKTQSTKRKRKRAIDCNSAIKGQCCKQKFYVNFKQLGWDDWVIAPAGYYANYCRGDCDEHHRTPDMFLNYYTHVIEEIRKKHELSGMQPCCAPIKFSSMSLIYFGPDNNIIKRDLPKMIVEECGCP